MNKTAIEWCDMTWNPVTGCLHGCPYCYAQRIARRFAARIEVDPETLTEKDVFRTCKGVNCESGAIHDTGLDTIQNQHNPYPYGFDPTFHRYRLDEPQRIKKPQNIFVCSMADLFGEWVPEEWIKAVFEACEKAPQHRYLFLTKNPLRHIALAKAGILPTKHYYGWTVTNRKDTHRNSLFPEYNTFVSFEPLYGDTNYFDYCNDAITGWAIVGAETGNRKGKVIPRRDWIENIVKGCRAGGVPIFMKDSLKEIWGEPLIREYPWEDR